MIVQSIQNFDLSAIEEGAVPASGWRDVAMAHTVVQSSSPDPEAVAGFF
jgi:hypothetical protein